MARLVFPVLSFVSILLATLPRIAAAHEHWIGKEAGTYVLHLGHRYSRHEGADELPFDASSVKDALCVDAKDVVQPVPVGTSHPVKIRAECSALLVSIASGYWSKTPWETRNAPRSEVPGAIKSWFSEESIKRIDRWMPVTAQPVGNGLEITPVSDPSQIRPGYKLTVRVTENRKPKAGVAVAYADSTRGSSGEDGTIAIRIREPGIQLISASYEAPLNDGKADSVIRSTVLQFEIPE